MLQTTKTVRLKHRNPLEKQIENDILRWLSYKNILACKIKTVGTFDLKRGRFRTPSPWYRKGVADILVCHQGKFIALEVKTKVGRLSPSQKHFFTDVAKAGGIAVLVRSVEDVAKVFNETVK